METLVIEDSYGRYRVTVEVEDGMFGDALVHDLAEEIFDMAWRASFAALVQNDQWPEHFLNRLRGYAGHMRDRVAKGNLPRGNACKVSRVSRWQGKPTLNPDGWSGPDVRRRCG